MLTTIAETCAAAVAGEGKIAALARLLRRVNEPAIVFTEYRDTLLHLERRLPGRRVVLLHGGMNRPERAEALRRFSEGERRMVLLTTDAAGEGLNLHHACRLVVNLELPWNPMRLEQRIGRVDRIGQTRRVHVVHLVARGTGESNILARLELRVSRAHHAVGAPNPLGRDDGERDGRTGGATRSRTSLLPKPNDCASRARLHRLRTESIESSLAIDSPWIPLPLAGQRGDAQRQREPQRQQPERVLAARMEALAQRSQHGWSLSAAPMAPRDPRSELRG